ncbi:DUF883 domain-containing protein [Zoogloea oleivorans]|uniref:DUF883 domain-containing protein n=1 Tax=Zoogloea oleivorans TaxID=1552750 RepID=A0A6C2CNZ6_9RHOO|nr:DUF883 family protein [Zoogloea oleivorans]TYC54935.1 DUF883 domain-containing protein [Zoogloea oleivorans]
MTNEMNAIRGAAEDGKDFLVKELKGVAGEASALMDDVGNSTAKGYAAARSSVLDSLDAARVRLDDASSRVGEQARHAADVTQVYVHKNPWQVLGGAAVLGFLIGFLVSRR